MADDKKPTTEKAAIMALLLGDVGELNDRVEQLKADLPAILGDIRNALRVTDVQGVFQQFIVYLTGGAVICVLVGVMAGYLVRMGTDAANLSTARESVEVANARAEAAESKAEKAEVTAQTAATARANAAIEAIRSGAKWADSEDGRLAKRFFENGGGKAAATCASEKWDVVKGADGKWCIPQRRDIIGGDSEKYGWKLP